MNAGQQQRLVEALRELCDTPLEHSSIARPLEAGVQAGRPFLVHTYLPGVPVDEYLQGHGRLTFSDVSLRVTHLAAAVDFAGAVGVCHGALGPRDILIAAQSTGVAGFGLAQALNDAGIEPGRPTVADDIYALAAMTYELLVGERYTGGDVRAALASLPGLGDVNLDALSGALESALSPDPAQWPTSALQFAGSLHDSLVLAGPPTRADGSRPAPPEDAPEFTGRLALFPVDAASGASALFPSEAPPVPARTAESSRIADLPLFDAPLRGPDAARFEEEIRPVPVPEPEPPMESLQFDAPPFSASVYASPHAGQAAAPATARGESWLPHPLTVATLTVIVLVALGAGLFLIGDLGSGIGDLGTLGGVFSGDRDDPAATADGPTGTTDPGAGGGSGDSDTAAGGGAPATEWPSAGDRESTLRDRVAPPPPVLVEPDAAPVVPAGGVAGGGSSARGGSAGGERAAVTPQDATETVSPSVSSVPAPDAGQARPDPPVAAAGARVAPAVTQGRVLVRSDPPGARVLIDGQFRGETPVAIRGLSLDAHTITVTTPGLPAWQREVTFTEERPAQSFDIVLGRNEPAARAPSPSAPQASSVAALLQVDSRPTGAQVWVDGRLVGITPLQLSGIEAGAHEVRLELSGYRSWSTSVSVARGERTRIAASLERQ